MSGRGQPKVSWIEILDTPQTPLQGVSDDKDILVFIDSEWGLPGVQQVTSQTEFVKYFGSTRLDNSFQPTKTNFKYLSWYLQEKLSSQYNLTVVKLGEDDPTKYQTQDFRFHVTDVDSTDPQDGFINIKQKYPGKLGNKLGLHMDYDVNTGNIIQEVLMLNKYDERNVVKEQKEINGVTYDVLDIIQGDEYIKLEQYTSQTTEVILEQHPDVNQGGTINQDLLQKYKLMELFSFINDNSDYLNVTVPDFDNLKQVLDDVFFDELDVNGDEILKRSFTLYMPTYDSQGTQKPRLREFHKQIQFFVTPNNISLDDSQVGDSIFTDSTSVSFSELINDFELNNPEKFQIKYVPMLGIQEHPSIKSQGILPGDIQTTLLMDLVLPQKYQILLQDQDNILDISNENDLQSKIDGGDFSIINIPSDKKGSYQQIHYPYLKQNNDLGNEFYQAPSFEVVKQNMSYDPWVQVQGLNRGGVSGTPQIVLSDQMQDILSQSNINQIRYFPDRNIVCIFDQKTKFQGTQQVNRLSQRETTSYIEEQLSVQLRTYLFENINQQTINGITSTCNIFLDDLVNRNQIYEYLTVVDDSPELVDNNTLGVTVKFKPMKHLEFVELNFMIKSLSSGL